VAIVERFESAASATDELIANNEQESRTLTAIRDTLLPKLLSGEIRAKDAGKFVEKAI
jgi:type I restriction enzyme S subunit